MVTAIAVMSLTHSMCPECASPAHNLFPPDPDEEVDIPSLSSAVEKKLPKYAQPMFIRLTKRLDLTGTAKLIKINFKKEGYDITKVTEPIFYKATGESEYNPLDINTFEKIMTATGTEKFVSKL